VGRQYSGTLGRIDNCQVGVFLGYASSRGHTLVNRRLYMLEPWFASTDAARARREHAMVPEGVRVQTKTKLGQEMLEAARAADISPTGGWPLFPPFDPGYLI
jgi:SRSO17 transposase